MLLANEVYKNIANTTITRHEFPDSIHFPRIDKLVHTPVKPDIPPHIGAVIKSNQAWYWIELIIIC